MLKKYLYAITFDSHSGDFCKEINEETLDLHIIGCAREYLCCRSNAKHEFIDTDIVSGYRDLDFERLIVICLARYILSDGNVP